MSQGISFSPLDLNEPIDPGDPFSLGWRYVPKAGKDGSQTMVQVPLTLEDILHPREEDFHVLSDPHTKDTIYLRGAFEMALRKVPRTVVLMDCRVAWDREGDFAHSPDCAVIFKVRKKKRWTTFNVAKEKTKPALIIEVTSPRTRSTDLVDKVREYAKQGVPHYVIADAREKKRSRRITLIDYYLTEGEQVYFTLPLSDDGRIWLPEVNLWLGAQAGQLVCHDADGNRAGTIVEEHERRLEAEKGRAEEQQSRLEAERLAEGERRSREELEQRAAEDRTALEAQIRDLENQLRRKPGSR